MLIQSRLGALVAWAPAKLNLHLEVLGKRDDGYHEIDTLMVTVNLYDSLCFREDSSGQLRLRCKLAEGVGGGADGSAHLPDGPGNLVMQAAEMLRRHVRSARGAAVVLTKRIPIAAGLAGGSSDAAATLVALNRLWDLRLPHRELAELAARLGSDVPFFLSGPAARCRGRGEQVQSLPAPLNWHFLIACPLVGLSTAEVYGHCRPPEQPREVAPLLQALLDGNVEAVGRMLFNRLQPAAEGLCTAVTRCRQAFERLAAAGHQMSGSGTSYFALCRSARHARVLAGRLSAPGRIFVVRSSP